MNVPRNSHVRISCASLVPQIAHSFDEPTDDIGWTLFTTPCNVYSKYYARGPQARRSGKLTGTHIYNGNPAGEGGRGLAPDPGTS